MDVERLRRMVDEPDETTYDDETLTATIARYPLLDERGQAPYTWDTASQPPTQDANENWIPTYDYHAAAALIWEEKAAPWATKYDFSADGGQFIRHQAYDMCMQMARFHNARRAPKTVRAHMWPEPSQNYLNVVDETTRNRLLNDRI